MLAALDDFSSILESIMELPPDIAPNHTVFVRGNDLHVLSELKNYLHGEEWVQGKRDAAGLSEY